MAQETNLRISVENFGPICEGTFELKPLTIFVGPNNAGKSYMAFLVYALSKALSGKLHWPFLGRGTMVGFGGIWGSDVKETDQDVGALFRLVLRTVGEKRELPWTDMPTVVQELYRRALASRLDALKGDLDEALRDYMGCEDVKELIRQNDGKKALCVSVNEQGGGPPFLNLSIETKRGIVVKWAPPDFSTLAVPPGAIPDFPVTAGRLRGNAEFLVGTLAASFWSQLLSANGFGWQEAYYLPPARSGILYGAQMYASMAVQIIRRRVGLERMVVPPFTGVAGDFLQLLWQGLGEGFVHERYYRRGERAKSKAMDAALGILEGEVLGGEVALEEQRTGERPLILYKSGQLQLPLQRASSMVGELAPLDLWIKYLLAPGDLLIIDEPEAHLHPESQRRIARVLVRVMRAGVKVLCTTHSSTILHQISNHILATSASPKVARKLHFNEVDLLKPEEVGVYLFEPGERGTVIKDVPIEPEFGVSEGEFVRVAEAIGEETFRLSTSHYGSEQVPS